jgi:hypothetical protein
MTMKNEYRLMNLIDDEWVIVAEGDIDTCQDYMHEYQPEPQPLNKSQYSPAPSFINLTSYVSSFIFKSP